MMVCMHLRLALLSEINNSKVLGNFKVTLGFGLWTLVLAFSHSHLEDTQLILKGKLE